MDPIVFVLVAAVLIGVAFYVVALPLVQHARRNTFTATTSSEQEQLAELLARRDAAFQALRELNFDHRVGKITDDDFAAFEAHLKQHAAETLRALDRWEAESGDDIEAAMEQAIRSRKAGLTSQPTGEPPARPDGRTCPKCGKPALTADKFCGKCGTALSARVLVMAPPASLTCPQCGQPHHSDDRFCGKCGAPLGAEVAPAAQ